MDQGLDSASKLLSLGRSLTRLSARNVTLMTLPTVTDPADPDRLLPEEPQDDIIFQMILDGQPWPQHCPRWRPARSGPGPERDSNAGPGRAGPPHGCAALASTSPGSATPPPTSATTVTYSGTAQADSAYTLMTRLQASPAAQNLLPEPAPQAGTAGPVTLVLGHRFRGRPGTGRPPRVGQRRAAGPAASPVQVRNAAASICSGLPAANPDPGEPG